MGNWSLTAQRETVPGLPFAWLAQPSRRRTKGPPGIGRKETSPVDHGRHGLAAQSIGLEEHHERAAEPDQIPQLASMCYGRSFSCPGGAMVAVVVLAEDRPAASVTVSVTV